MEGEKEGSSGGGGRRKGPLGGRGWAARASGPRLLGASTSPPQCTPPAPPSPPPPPSPHPAPPQGYIDLMGDPDVWEGHEAFKDYDAAAFSLAA